MANTSTQYVEKWLKLNQEGHFQEAKDFYFESLFAAVIEDFKARTEGRFKKGSLHIHGSYRYPVLYAGSQAYICNDSARMVPSDLHLAVHLLGCYLQGAQRACTC